MGLWPRKQATRIDCQLPRIFGGSREIPAIAGFGPRTHARRKGEIKPAGLGNVRKRRRIRIALVAHDPMVVRRGIRRFLRGRGARRGGLGWGMRCFPNGRRGPARVGPMGDSPFPSRPGGPAAGEFVVFLAAGGFPGGIRRGKTRRPQI